MRAGEKAYQALRTDIVEGALPPGAVLGEAEQAERIGVSRTPIREAISRLQADGLVNQAEGRGVLVAPISLENVTALFELRQALDTSAASLAARKANPAVFLKLAERFAQAARDIETGAADLTQYYFLVAELDQEIDQAADNHYLVQAQRTLRIQLERIRRLSKTNPLRLAQAAHEHSLIAHAIASGDPQLAHSATTVHLANALLNIETAIAQPTQH